MTISGRISCAILLLVLGLAPAAPGDTAGKREILGLHVNMPKSEVHKRLEQIGKFVRDERKRQEVWEVRDDTFSHVVVGFDSGQLLRYVTAVAREDKEAKRIAYSDVGKVGEAQQAGDPKINNFNYEWRLAAAKGQPGGVIIARGRDPKYLSTYSLKRLADQSEAEAEEKE